jgi:hypothetical protein
MPVLTDTLKLWLKGFRALKVACSRVNTSTKTKTQNAFGNTVITALLPNSGNVVTFTRYANEEFANAGLSNWDLEQPFDTSSNFFTLMTFPLWHKLDFCVKLFVQAFCPATCLDANGDLDLTKSVNMAFPGGEANNDWQALMSALTTVKLDAVLAKGAFTNAGQTVAPDSGATLSDLIAALSAV